MADEYLDVNQPVASDAVYCRDDDRDVEEAITTDSTAICYYGLRRFGKSSFLRKIERHAREKRHLAEQARVFYFDIEKFPVNLGVLAEAEQSAKDQSRRTVLLLDDLRQLELKPDKKRVEREFFPSVRRLKELGVRLIVSEPTNLGEYLAGEKSSDGRPNLYGKEFSSVFTDDIESKFRLRKLSRQETEKMLCGNITRKPSRQLDDSFITAAHTEFGGNPWLLSHARHALDEHEHLSRNFEDLQVSVGKRIAKSDPLSSIYGSLRREEQFVLRVLHAVDRGGSNEARDMKGKRFWRTTPEVRRTSARLEDLGLIDAQEGYPRRIVPQSILQLIDDLVSDGKRTPLEQQFREVRRDWTNFISIQHPDHNNRGELIIHQLSDVLHGLEGGGEDELSTLQRYRAYLQFLAEDEERKKERPHFVVICGNLITGHDDEDAREDFIKSAAGELETISDLLQDLHDLSKKDAQKERAKRIILIPGVFDLEWQKLQKGKVKYADCCTIWNRQMKRKDFSTTDGSVLSFANTPLGDLVFLPFDSLSLDAVKERLGVDAVDDIMDIRRALQGNACDPMHTWLRQPELNENGEREVRARFVEHTLRYIVDTPLKEADGSEAVSEPSFRWSIGNGDSEQGDRDRCVRYSDVGFVSRKGMEMIETSRVKYHDAIKIGLIHHHPFQHNLSPVSEFYEGVQLRRRLAESGVQVLLHGHSPSPCMRTEIMSTPSRTSTSAQGVGRRLRLIASGTFCPEARFEVNLESLKHPDDWQNAEIERSMPTFNCLRIKRNEDNDEEFDVALDVYEMTPDSNDGESFQSSVALGKFRLPAHG